MDPVLKQLKDDNIFKDSLTENNAIKLFDTLDFQNMKSVGISTAGFIEGYYASKDKHVVATTLDNDGIQYMQGLLKDMNGHENIEYRCEDASLPSPDKNNSFDIIYSRLCLHYLSNQQLEVALKDFYRILKPSGVLFIVVRSTKDIQNKSLNITFNPIDGMSTIYNKDMYASQKRRFHTVESIKNAVISVGFQVIETVELQERLCSDWKRLDVNEKDAEVIQLIARKRNI